MSFISFLIILAFQLDYSPAEVERFYKKDLAGQLGNLLSRVSNKKLLLKLASPGALYTTPVHLEPMDRELFAALDGLSSRLHGAGLRF